MLFEPFFCDITNSVRGKDRIMDVKKDVTTWFIPSTVVVKKLILDVTENNEVFAPINRETILYFFNSRNKGTLKKLHNSGYVNLLYGGFIK